MLEEKKKKNDEEEEEEEGEGFRRALWLQNQRHAWKSAGKMVRTL